MKCYNCGEDTVIWQCDYDFDDYGIEGSGIVSVYYCMNCKALIEVYIPNEEEE